MRFVLAIVGFIAAGGVLLNFASAEGLYQTCYERGCYTNSDGHNVPRPTKQYHKD